ncbi:hypothetical protein ACFL2M_02095 [Patescibacteria group bacterium]
MSKKKRKSWQQKVWIIISIVAIIAMVFFTALPFFSGQAGY